MSLRYTLSILLRQQCRRLLPLPTCYLPNSKPNYHNSHPEFTVLTLNQFSPSKFSLSRLKNSRSKNTTIKKLYVMTKKEPQRHVTYHQMSPQIQHTQNSKNNTQTHTYKKKFPTVKTKRKHRSNSVPLNFQNGSVEVKMLFRHGTPTSIFKLFPEFFSKVFPKLRILR